MRHGIATTTDALDSVTIKSGGLEGTPGAESEYPVANIATVERGTSHRPAAAGSGKLLFQLDEAKGIGSGHLAVAGMTGVDDCLRLRWGPWAEKPALPLVAGGTPLSIAETASWTVACLAVLEPANMRGTTDDIFRLSLHLTGTTNTNLLVQLKVSSAAGGGGLPSVNLPRHSGSANEMVFGTTRIDNGEPFVFALALDGSGGAPWTATAYLSDPATRQMVSVGTMETSDAFTSATETLATSGNHHVGWLEYWNRALSLAELNQLMALVPSADWPGLESGIAVTVGDVAGWPGDLVIDDVTGAHPFTLSGGGGSFSEIANPLAYSPAAVPRYQPWTRRPTLRLRSASSGQVTTGSTLSNSPLATVAFGILQSLAPVALSNLYFYANVAVDRYLALQLQTDGTILLAVKRGAAAQVTVAGTTDVCDGEPHVVALHVDWGDEISLSIDGTAEGGATTAAAFSSASDYRNEFGFVAAGSDAEIFGPAFMVLRYMSPAAAYAVVTGTVPLMPTQAYLHYSCTELTGGPSNSGGATAGSAGDLTISGSPAKADWVKNGATNPAAGPLSDTSVSISQQWCEIAPGVNVESSQALLEWYSAAVPTFYALAFARGIWPAMNAQGASLGSRSEETTGAGMTTAQNGAIFTDLQATAQQVAATFPLLEEGEAVELWHQLVAAASAYRDGDVVNSSWIAIIDAPDHLARHHWANRCRLGLPSVEKSAASWRTQVAYPATAVAKVQSIRIVVQDLFVGIS